VISIVTPSFQQGRFLEDALRSVLDQSVDLEYVVIDGGSTDGSVDVIERYQDRLTVWRSEPDRGQYDAINKGFQLTKGEIMGWLNADDFYAPNALSIVEDIFGRFPQVEWLTSTFAASANARGQIHSIRGVPVYDRDAFFRGFNLPVLGEHTSNFIPQESTFWRRSLWERVGGSVDASLEFAGDFDLWARFYGEAELWGVRAVIGVLRLQPEQKSRVGFESYIAEAERVLLERGGGRYSGSERTARRLLARRLTNMRIWRFPTIVRQPLERRGVLHKTRELVWKSYEEQWTTNNVYFL
jgi:glycosyltransferase involved in cell wall biosynthesis